MKVLTDKSLAVIHLEKIKHQEEFTSLISNPFDLNNSDHQIKLKKYVDDFEFSLNQMYIFDSIGAEVQLKFWGWLATNLLPLPHFITYFADILFYSGVASRLLQHFTINDFEAQATEMKTLYNWCLKNGKDTYDPSIDNGERLNNADIQRMIKLLAPLSNVKDMIVWQCEQEKSANTTTLSQVANSVYTIFQQAKTESAEVKEMKHKVENRAYNLGTSDRFYQGINYFTKSPQFREYLWTYVNQPRETVKMILPEAVRGMV